MSDRLLTFCPVSRETEPREPPREGEGLPRTKGTELSKVLFLLSFSIGKTAFSFVRLLSYCPMAKTFCPVHVTRTKGFVRTFCHHPPTGIEATK